MFRNIKKKQNDIRENDKYQTSVKKMTKLCGTVIDIAEYITVGVFCSTIDVAKGLFARKEDEE